MLDDVDDLLGNTLGDRLRLVSRPFELAVELTRRSQDGQFANPTSQSSLVPQIAVERPATLREFGTVQHDPTRAPQTPNGVGEAVVDSLPASSSSSRLGSGSLQPDIASTSSRYMSYLNLTLSCRERRGKRHYGLLAIGVIRNHPRPEFRTSVMGVLCSRNQSSVSPDATRPVSMLWTVSSGGPASRGCGARCWWIWWMKWTAFPASLRQLPFAATVVDDFFRGLNDCNFAITAIRRRGGSQGARSTGLGRAMTNTAQKFICLRGRAPTDRRDHEQGLARHRARRRLRE